MVAMVVNDGFTSDKLVGFFQCLSLLSTSGMNRFPSRHTNLDCWQFCRCRRIKNDGFKLVVHQPLVPLV